MILPIRKLSTAALAALAVSLTAAPASASGVRIDPDGRVVDQGSCIDPNGCINPNAQESDAGGTMDPNGRGMGIDPNGRGLWGWLAGLFGWR